jgi:hypothetical protein
MPTPPNIHPDADAATVKYIFGATTRSTVLELMMPTARAARQRLRRNFDGHSDAAPHPAMYILNKNLPSASADADAAPHQAQVNVDHLLGRRPRAGRQLEVDYSSPLFGQHAAVGGADSYRRWEKLPRGWPARESRAGGDGHEREHNLTTPALAL